MNMVHRGRLWPVSAGPCLIVHESVSEAKLGSGRRFLPGLGQPERRPGDKPAPAG